MSGSIHNEKSKLISSDHLNEKPSLDELPPKQIDSNPPPSNLPSLFQFPKSVYFIVANEFCERFNYFGVRTILTLYLMQFIGLGPNHATAIFHLFVVLCYFSPIFGGVIADSVLGRFWTICILSVVYSIGGVVLAATAVPNAGLTGALIGLLLIGIGTGGIKPNVCAFGAEQINADNHHLRDVYFSTFYFSINFGSLVATIFIPIVRSRITCMGDSCYALAFAIPAVAMIISLIVFIAGKAQYQMSQPGDSILTKSAACIVNAISNYRAAEISDPTKSLLDYADPQLYPPEFVRDLRQLSHLLLLYVPFPIFWALFDQMGSRWTIQASLMDGYVGNGLSVLPDQMQGVNSLLILFFIPLFDCFVYPLVERWGITASLLRRIGAGMLLASAAFIAAMLLQLQIESELPAVPMDGEMKLKFANTISNCHVTMGYNDREFSLAPHSLSSAYIVSAKIPITGVSATSDECKINLLTNLKPNTINNSYDILAFTNDNSEAKLAIIPAQTVKHKKGLALVRIMVISDRLFNRINNGTVVLTRTGREEENATFDIGDSWPAFSEQLSLRITQYAALHRGFYSTRLLLPGQDPITLPTVNVKNGQILTLVLTEAGNYSISYFVLEEVRANSVRMMWQLPQYLLISLAEVLFAVSGLTLSYAEAPNSMKSLVQALWLLCVAVGNVFVMIVSETRLAHHQSIEFLMFALIMLLNVLLFTVLSRRYRPFSSDCTEIPMVNKGEGD